MYTYLGQSLHRISFQEQSRQVFYFTFYGKIILFNKTGRGENREAPTGRPPCCLASPKMWRRCETPGANSVTVALRDGSGHTFMIANAVVNCISLVCGNVGHPSTKTYFVIGNPSSKTNMAV